MTIEGKTALVTGGGQGIGQGCALALAKAGATLVLNDRPGSAELARTADQIRALGGKCHTVEGDVFCGEARERLVAEAIDKAGAINIFVSNPALNIRRPFLEFELADFERIVAATLVSAFHMSQLVARSMVSAGRGGKIVFVSSVHAEMPFANNVAYGASKAGLNHLAETMSVELAPHRVNVNTIEPGWIDTPGERAMSSEDVLEREGKKLPWKRMGTVDDIGDAVVFLASDAADYITGATIPVDGGFRFRHCAPGSSE